MTVQEISEMIAKKWGRSVFLDEALTFKPEDKVRINKALIEEKKLPKLDKKIRDISYLDGCKVNFTDDSYVICRFSGTEPLLRIMAEAETEQEARSYLAVFRSFVEGLM